MARLLRSLYNYRRNQGDCRRLSSRCTAVTIRTTPLRCLSRACAAMEPRHKSVPLGLRPQLFPPRPLRSKSGTAPPITPCSISSENRRLSARAGAAALSPNVENNPQPTVQRVPTPSPLCSILSPPSFSPPSAPFLLHCSAPNTHARQAPPFLPQAPTGSAVARSPSRGSAVCCAVFSASQTLPPCNPPRAEKAAPAITTDVSCASGLLRAAGLSLATHSMRRRQRRGVLLPAR